MAVTFPELFNALRDLIQWGDLTELPLDQKDDYVGVPMGGLRNSLNTSDEETTREGAARLLRYVAEFEDIPKNVGLGDSVEIVNRWILENRP